MLHRCSWASKEIFHPYHDNEWGLPQHEDRKHFEMLILEGAQAGLTWESILKKRSGYAKVFYSFNPLKCAQLTDTYLQSQLNNQAIIRNRLKIFSVRKNAQVFLKIQEEFTTFDTYIWQFVGGRQKVNCFQKLSNIPAITPESNAISKDLKKRGMSFVGPTIIYAYMQATGLVNDHEKSCFRYDQCIESSHSSS